MRLPDGKDIDPSRWLAGLVATAETCTSDAELIDLGVGDLESFLMVYEDAVWSEIDAAARSSAKFRRALRNVWYDGSEHASDRERLLFELGEWIEVRVECIAYIDDAEVECRAPKIRTTLGPAQLATVLRQMADHLDEPDRWIMRDWKP